MERPVSAASETTTTTTTTTHASVKNGIRPTSGSTLLSLFVTNLRLLNLDLLPDWPNIATASFSPHDARTRIKCSEYALYQLFRLYDPATTADKLQPFFPPLEPLQSVNLRAALFRCLNELKKSGVLPREAVLRKSMLDECQGDKFWELCLNFSAVVLPKCTQKKKRQSVPFAEKVGSAGGISKSEKESMLPLAIAHRAALSKVLAEKAKKKETYARLYDILLEKQDDVQQRKMKVEELAQKTKATEPEKINAVEQVIERSWVGSTELKDALIGGDTCPKGDGMLLQPFDKLWNSDNTVSRETGGAEIGLLQRLNDKAVEQTARLKRYQIFHDRLLASAPASVRSSRPGSGSQKPKIMFNKHRDINLHDTSSDDSDRQDPPRQPKRARHGSITRYDEILTAMREELRKNSSAQRSNAPARPTTITPLKRAQTQPEPHRKPSLNLDVSPGAPDPHARSPSQTAVPMRTPAGRRVSSRSRSYQQPKVISQREPIPLKAELFSPLKEKRASSASPLSEDGTAATAASPRDSGLGIKNVDFGFPTSSSGESSLKDSDGEQPPQTTNETTRPSLAERTRQSMVFPPTAAEDTTAPFDRRTSLLDRTRQSISLAPAPSTQPKRSAQVETPPRQQKRDLTPLLSPDAEYDSVFKSRPRVALSPVLSPADGGGEGDGSDESGCGGSPLGGRG